jgi:non-canonical (house-cleaning) NTP pyrophosphatase
LIYAKEKNIEADLYAAIEGGIFEFHGQWFMTDIAAIRNTEGTINYGMSGSYSIPEEYVEDIKEKTLGKVIDSIFGTDNCRYETGAVGILTKNEMTRLDITKDAFQLALIKHLNKKW